MNIDEIWKPVPVDKFGMYEISNHGKMRNTRTGRILKPNLGKYWRYTMSVDGELKRVQAHRMVAEAFVPNPCDKFYVNHKDGCKTNNHVSNLEWVTQSENQTHAVLTGLQAVGSQTSYSKLTEEDVQKIRALVKQGVSQYQIAKMYGVTQPLISMIHLRKWWKHVPDEEITR
jgi:hypothetical protein